MNEEKELLQEVAGMGELVEPWNSRQLEVLDRHLQLLHLYSQAKENLRSFRGNHFHFPFDCRRKNLLNVGCDKDFHHTSFLLYYFTFNSSENALKTQRNIIV